MSLGTLIRWVPTTLAAATAAASVAVAAGPVKSQMAQVQRERAAAIRKAALISQQLQVSQLQRLLEQDLRAISSIQSLSPQAGKSALNFSLPNLPPVNTPAAHATTGASGLG